MREETDTCGRREPRRGVPGAILDTAPRRQVARASGQQCSHAPEQPPEACHALA